MGELTLAEARRRVISNYDRHESKRITKYNLDLVVSMARRRIMKWAKYGSGHEAHIDPVDRLIPGGIQKLVLPRDWISHWSCAALILTSEMPPSDEEIRMPPLMNPPANDVAQMPLASIPSMKMITGVLVIILAQWQNPFAIIHDTAAHSSSAIIIPTPWVEGEGRRD
ncbi:hypothetical protein FALCPG4_004366 [Fusarium falciforme]